MGVPSVFLSYSHADRDEALRLRDALEVRGLEVHVDEGAMQAGEGIRSFIERSIESTDATVCLVSNRSLASAWVALETVEAFHASRRGRPFIGCYIDPQFLEDTGFRLSLTDQIDERIAEIDALLPEYQAKSLDTDDLNQQKTRLYQLRNNLGSILLRLRESLTLDVRGDAVGRSADLIKERLNEAPGTADERGERQGSGGLRRRVPARLLVLDAAVGALSATLIKERLIPDNIDVLGTVAVLMVVVGLSITVVQRRRLRAMSGRIAIAALGSLLLLLAVQLAFVETVSPYGPDGGEREFLRGFQLTEEGRAWVADPLIPSGSVSELISSIGHDMIPTAWGWSYYALALTYSVAYLALILAVVLALGGMDLVAGRNPPAPGEGEE